MEDYKSLETAHTIIRAALQRCDAWVQRMLDQRELRAFWFQFDDYATQEDMLRSLQQLQPGNEERLILSLVQRALRPEVSRSVLQKQCSGVPHLWSEVERVSEHSKQKEYVIIFSDPVAVTSKKMFFMTVNSTQEDLDRRLLEVLAKPGGLLVLLDAYKEKQRQGGWIPAPHMIRILYAEFQKTSCRQCGATDKKLLRCSLCKTARYCDVGCQKKDWMIHKCFCGTEKDICARFHQLVPSK